MTWFSKLLAIGLLFFVILMSFLVGSAYQQAKETIKTKDVISITPNQLSQKSADDWLIYRNEELGIQFLYPSDWQIKHGATSAEYWLVKKNSTNDIGESEIFIGRQPYSYESLAVAMKKDFYLLSLYDPDKNIIIDGFPAIQGRLVKPNDPPEKVNEWVGGLIKETLIVNRPDLYTIYAIGENINEVESVYDQMLTTIRFIKEPKSDRADTSNWKTYRNEKYGLEFKYPPEWVIKDTSQGAGYAVYELSVYPVDPDIFCEKLRDRQETAMLCGVDPVLQIYEENNANSYVRIGTVDVYSAEQMAKDALSTKDERSYILSIDGKRLSINISLELQNGIPVSKEDISASLSSFQLIK